MDNIEAIKTLQWDLAQKQLELDNAMFLLRQTLAEKENYEHEVIRLKAELERLRELYRNLTGE